MALSPTPALIQQLHQIYTDVQNAQWDGIVPEDDFKGDPARKVEKAATMYSTRVGQAIDEWMVAIKLIILPGLVVVGSPTTQTSVAPYSNILKV